MQTEHLCQMITPASHYRTIQLLSGVGTQLEEIRGYLHAQSLQTDLITSNGPLLRLNPAHLCHLINRRMCCVIMSLTLRPGQWRVPDPLPLVPSDTPSST